MSGKELSEEENDVNLMLFASADPISFEEVVSSDN